MSSGFVSRAAGLFVAFTIMFTTSWASPAAAQCGGTQLCAPGAGDCTIAADCTITMPAGGLTIDLGARRLVVNNNRTLRVNGPEGAGLTLKVGDFLLNGGTILLPGVNMIAGNLTVLSATNITVQNSGTIDVSAGLGAGILDLEALAGNINYSGRIKAEATSTRQGFGGDVSLFATGSVTVGGNFVDASGGDLGAAGGISLDAFTGAVSVSVPLKALGGDGGDIEIFAGTTIMTTAPAIIDVHANGDAGSGGSVDLSAFGNVTLGGEVIGQGSAADFREEGRTGGDGADVDVFSETGTVAINGKIDVSGAPGGFGGGIDLFADQNLTFSKQIFSQTDGIEGAGGDVFLTAGGTMTLSQNIDVRGRLGSGGSIEAISIGNATVSAVLNADGDTAGGTIFVSGCVVNVTGPGVLQAQGPGGLPLGSNVIQAGSTLTVNGDLKATSQNLLEVRQLPLPTVTGTAAPAVIRQVDPLIPCCVGCPVTTTTSTTTSLAPTTTSSTTSTTRPTTTTTSTSSTTSSTGAPTTTTTTTTSTTSTTTTSSTTSTTSSTTTSTTSTTTTSSTTSTTSTPTTTSSTTTTTVADDTCGTLRTGCRLPVVPLKAPFKLKDSAKGPQSDQFNWKWDSGASTELADFADPTTTDGYAVCVFDRSQASPSLLFRAAAAPGGNCGTATKPKNCWVGNGKNFKFTSKTPNADGVVSIVLTPGAGGKAKAQVKAKGINLSNRPFGLPAVPLPLPITVQLQSENGQCWEANYSAAGVKKNTAGAFEAKAD